MEKALQFSYRVLCFVIVVCMAFMTVMVFVNTVLRYVSNTSIIQSEELSRFLFVWMVFCGSIVAMADDIHIRVDILVCRLPASIRRVLGVISYACMTVICYLLLVGGYVQTAINWTNYAPATNIPLAVVYLSVIISGAGMGLICLVRTLKFLFVGIDTGKKEAAQ